VKLNNLLQIDVTFIGSMVLLFLFFFVFFTQKKVARGKKLTPILIFKIFNKIFSGVSLKIIYFHIFVAALKGFS
jgi:hypothetical protein